MIEETPELKLRIVKRLEPVVLGSMGEIKDGDLFTLGPAGEEGEDPFEDGKDIYLARSDAYPEKPVGNHGIQTVTVGRVGFEEEGLPKGVKAIKLNITMEMEDGTEQKRDYDIHPNTFNLAEVKEVIKEGENLVGGPKRMMVAGITL